MIPLVNFPLYVTKEAYSLFNGVKGHSCFLVCLKTSCPLAMKQFAAKNAYKLNDHKMNAYKIDKYNLRKEKHKLNVNVK